MKKVKMITIALAAVLLTGFAANAQSNTMANIETTILGFANAADNSDAKGLESYLDENYSVVMNRLFGSDKVSVMNKEVYLSKIASKEFGGDKRIVTIHSIVINGATANAKVTFQGTKMTFISLLGLVQDQNGNWKLISDTPVLE